ncbi:MAG: hypothetical protein GF313_15065 [Caldithrix sp.]|nr:hypothetical protein [Caldithrix sp.]
MQISIVQKLIVCLVLCTVILYSDNQEKKEWEIKSIHLPNRSNDALSGTTFINSIKHLPFEQREQAILNEILSGNVPLFMHINGEP